MTVLDKINKAVDIEHMVCRTEVPYLFKKIIIEENKQITQLLIKISQRNQFSKHFIKNSSDIVIRIASSEKSKLIWDASITILLLNKS